MKEIEKISLAIQNELEDYTDWAKLDDEFYVDTYSKPLTHKEEYREDYYEYIFDGEMERGYDY